MMSKDATIRVKWEKNKSNLWAGFRQKAASKKGANDEPEERTESVAHNNGAVSTASFEENRDDENVKPQNENTSQLEAAFNKREGDSHTSQPHKEAVDLTRSLSKLKKKIKNPLDGASISIRSSFSCSFGEIIKNKAYKEIVDEQRNEKADDAALIENEFDLIANRKSREGLEDKMTENKVNGTEPDSVARESSAVAYQTLEDFLEKKNRQESPTTRIQDEALYGIAESVEEKTNHSKTILSESIYTIGNVKSGEVATERTEEASKHQYSKGEGFDADAIFFQTSQSQTTGTETYVDDQTTRYQDSKILNTVLQRTACCVTGAGSGLISRAPPPPSKKSSTSPSTKQIRKYPIKDDVDNDFLPVELAMHGEKTVIEVDGQQVCDVRFLRGRRVFRLERNKLKGRRIFSNKRVYESVKGRREELVIPKEQSTRFEIDNEELPQNAQVTRLTKGRKKVNMHMGKNVGISKQDDVIVKRESAHKASKMKVKKNRKEERSRKKNSDEAEGYSADEEDEGGLNVSKPTIVGPSYRHLHPGKSIYWLKVGDGVEKSLKLNNSPANEKSVYWLKVGEEVPQTT